MLEGVVVIGLDDLTADDESLHQMLISRAYDEDSLMSAEPHSFDMSEAVRCLGSRVERSDIRLSLARLKRTTVSYGRSSERRFEDVQLLEGWIEVAPGSDIIRYRLPEPLRVLMRNQREYAYIELAALPKMRSKFSSRLYKQLALRAAKQKWVPGDDNTITVSGTPDEVAEWIGFPKEANGKVHVGKLRARFLDKVESDFADVRAFRLEYVPHEPGGRGNPLARVEFVLHLAPPPRHSVPMFFKPSDSTVRVGNKDIIGYRVESRTWRRAATKFGRRLVMTNRGIADFWLIALNEAISGVALSDGYHTRKFRGSRLLDAIRSRDADYAAWGFVSEEADVPDLAAKQGQPGYTAIEREADEARQQRIGFGKRKRQAPAFINDQSEDVARSAAATSITTFADCREIVFTVDPALTAINVDALVGSHIQKLRFTGSRSVMLTLRFMEAGRCDTWELGKFPVSEADLEGILKSFGRHFDGIEEYL
nr:RepB family plasmid replication initiator protein [Mesorhizobium sp. M8A.F.Ca.ET.207.01.1.1]